MTQTHIEYKLDMIENKIDRLFGLLQHKNENSEYLTVSETTKLLRKTSFTIRRWIKQGKLVATKLNGGSQRDQYSIERQSIEKFLKG